MRQAVGQIGAGDLQWSLGVFRGAPALASYWLKSRIWRWRSIRVPRVSYFVKGEHKWKTYAGR
jgi:hypothetical protein